MVCIPIYTKIGDGYYCSAMLCSYFVSGGAPFARGEWGFKPWSSHLCWDSFRYIAGQNMANKQPFLVWIWGSKIYIYISVYNIYNLYEYQICIYIYMDSLGCESMICWGTVWNGVAGVWDLLGFSSFAGKWLQSGTCMDMQFRALNRIWPAINGRFSQL